MKPSVAVVGAGGLVGSELLKLIEKRKFPYSEIKFYGSLKKTKEVIFKNRKIRLKKPDPEKLKKSNIVFFVSSDDVSKMFARKLAQQGVWCIDDSSAFRMEKDIPLVIPEVNGDLITEKTKLIAGPNCTLTPLAVSCFKIHTIYHIKEIRIATYQAVSGAGKRALEELFNQSIEFLKYGKIKKQKKVFPRQIAFNLFPQVGCFDEKGNSVEENKLELELRKIWNTDDINLSTYAVRVPVVRGHSLAVWIKTQKKWNINDIAEILKKTPGCRFSEDHYEYFTPVDVAKKEYVTASRLKETPFENEFSLWLCGDNLYKGAALNSIQIAEIILKKFMK